MSSIGRGWRGQRRRPEPRAGRAADGVVVVFQRGTLRVVSAGGRLAAERRTSRGVGTGGAGGATGVSWAASRSHEHIESLQRGRGAGSETLWVIAFTSGIGVFVEAVAYQRA